MTTPKFKEKPFTRWSRLNLGKPHIAWSRVFGQWLAFGSDDDARRFCIARDARWTPRGRP